MGNGKREREGGGKSINKEKERERIVPRVEGGKENTHAITTVGK